MENTSALLCYKELPVWNSAAVPAMFRENTIPRQVLGPN